ncbi:MAG: lipid IV(A) 3-deoxy-D-manno-octulosonic acid transferase [Plesiomonas sp.]
MLYRTFYTLLLIMFFPVIAIMLYRPQPGKAHFGKRWKEHFGFTPPLTDTASAPIWLHAVSVGEVLASIPLIEKLKAAHPTIPIVLTTTTRTGAEQAEKLGDKVHHRYMPLDYPWTIQRFIRQLNPQLLLIMETELWPNTLYAAKKANIPVLILNARLSERSCRRYGRISSLFNILSSPISQFICQSQDDAARFIRLGVATDKLSVSGSVKFDLTLPENITPNAALLRAEFPKNALIWIAASTHKGEDEQVLDAFTRIRQTIPESRLILVPRHPQRFDDVAALCQQRGWLISRRSMQASPDPADIYLGDTMGELLMLLAVAQIAFIGGSLVPVGGHNLLEPAAVGIPSIIGPHYFNFTDITQRLLACGATQICQDSESLATAVIQALQQPTLCQQQGQAGQNLVRVNRGAVNNMLNTVERYLQ